MTSTTHQLKNAMYAAELIRSTGVLGFQTFKPVFCMYNKLRLQVVWEGPRFPDFCGGLSLKCGGSGGFSLAYGGIN